MQVKLFNTLPLNHAAVMKTPAFLTDRFCNCPRPFCYHTERLKVDLIISEDHLNIHHVGGVLM